MTESGKHDDAESSAEPIRGTKVGRFTILDPLGVGSTGCVFAAYDPDLDRKVALKVLRGDYPVEQRLRLAAASTVGGGDSGDSTGVGAGPIQERQQRLLREARALAKLSHPNVVTAYDVGLHGNDIFIAMQHIDGRTLRRWLETKRTAQEILEVFARAGAGLGAAHRAGLVHRDFKPDNVMIDRDGQVHVLDFGLVRDFTVEEPGPAVAGGSPTADPSARLTATGSVMGTPAYMAPEQYLGRPADARSDQFSFCVSLYEALFGQRPFAGATSSEVGRRMLDGEPPAIPSRRDVPARVRRALARGLERDPDRRWPSLDDLLRELAAGHRRRSATVFAAVGVIVALGTGALLLGRSGTDPAANCAAAEDRLGGVWDDGVRARVRDAFAASPAPYAKATARHVAASLDRYAAKWSAGYREACEATFVRRTQSRELLDLRIACLDQRLEALRALVQRLVRADEETVERGAELADRLPKVASCADTAGLLAADPLPADSARRDEIRRLRAELAVMPIDARHGEHDRLLGRLGEMTERAREIGYEPLRAEVLLARSRLLYELRDVGGAEEACFGSLVAAEAGHHRELFADALVELIRSSGCSGGVRWTARLGALVEARLEASRNRESLDLARLQNMAEAFLYWIEPVRVLEVLAPARERFERYFGADSPGYAEYLTVLARAATYIDQVEEPGELLAAARTILEAQLGPLHPRLVPVLFGLAELHLRRAEPQGAEAVARSAVDAVVLQAGAAPSLRVQALVYLADGLSLLGRTAEGDAAYAHAREAAQTLGQSRWVAGLVDCREGAQRLRQGRVEAALALGRSSLAHYEAALGPDALDVLWSVHLLGEAELAAGRPALARPWFERMRALVEARSSDTPVLAYALRGLGECSLLEGRPEQALEPLERALALRRTAPGWYWARPQTAYALARALWATGREHPRAVRLAGEALDGLAAVATPSERDRLLREEVRRWLSERSGGEEPARPTPPADDDPETPAPTTDPVTAARPYERRVTICRARATEA